MSAFSNCLIHEKFEYGALCNNLSDHTDKTYYLTTAISYTNGNPHIGHAYEFITADTIVRYHRVLGYNTFFLTGTDEHGQKVAASAEKSELSPLDHCNIYVNAFQMLDKRLLISYSDFQRTTDPNHILTSQKLWSMCSDSGDIYLDAYEGWYNEREEVFVSNVDAEAADFKDVGSGLPLKKVKEESYFFKMSTYADPLIKYIEENPSFIEPEQFRNNILGRLKKEGLKDLSISRTSFDWGIPVPEGFDSKHVMYVWFDALTNYLSGVDALEVRNNNLENVRKLKDYWPASKHIIGKDIIWFHCVIWPCMLLSAKLPLPHGVFSHGFVNASDGRKMSKSYNNTICPNEILAKYPVDTIRYYLCAATTYGSDLNFSEDSLIAMHNSELADILGNLAHRVLTLAQKYCQGIVPDTEHDNAFGLPFDLAALKTSIENDMKECSISTALFKVMDAVRATNRFLTEAEPWKMKGTDEPRRISIVRTALEAIYAFTHFLAPVIPIAGKYIFDNLNTEPVSTYNLRNDMYNLTPGTSISIGDILFQKIELVVDQIDSKVNSGVMTDKSKINLSKNREEIEEIHEIEFTKIEFRVGRILKIWEHEKSDRLYCEEIDLGPVLGIRQVASGLRSYYKKEELLNRLVIVVCNLKESKFQGFLSCGMILAAKFEDKVEIVNVIEGSQLGEQVQLQGYSGSYPTPYNTTKTKKLKTWESVVVDLHTNEVAVACWRNMQFSTSAGICTVSSITNSPIS